jgi:response regulator of citrate/malate metabolism
VIILSNLNSINDINKSYELGAVDYLIKEQVNFEIIRFKIEMALNKKKSPEKVSKAGLMK